jgi:3-methylcrotonyl-CoA carboxylase alpha subunit
VFTVGIGEQSHRVVIAADGAATVDGGAPLAVTRSGRGVCLVDDGSRVRRAFVAGTGSHRQVFVDGEVFDLEVGPEAAGGRRGGRAAADLLSAPMPARVTAIVVQPGQAVRKGDVLVKLEAMKMEMAVRAPRDGTVSAVSCRVGELVQPGIGLVEIA